MLKEVKKRIRGKILFWGMIGIVVIPGGLIYCTIIRNIILTAGQILMVCAMVFACVFVTALITILLSILYRDSIDDQYADFGSFELETRKAQIQQLLNDRQESKRKILGQDQWKEENA
nr:hypothetical protein 14 [bacterium]